MGDLMVKKNSSFYFLYVIIIITLFLWLIFSATEIIEKNLNLSTSVSIVANFIPAIFSAVAIILAFSIATPLVNEFLVTLRRLLRLDNLSNPLLLKLSLSAPGTYHHSINVSNLGQKAAKAIGADSLLIRVAAYYHDIGKLENPEFYIENQTEEDRKTIVKTPKQSAKIIISHVQKGLKTARANNLTDDICDLIAEHHGTMLVGYFFEIAKNEDGATLRDDFRYPGPKPSSKEAGILMIADSAEAGVRSLSEIKNGDIEKTVIQVITERINEGQLENSGLSEKEIKKIELSIIDTLKVVYHRRIIKQ